MISRYIFGWSAALFLTLTALTAGAHGECRADREKFCKDAPKGQVGKCMKQNQDLLSPSCQSFLEEKRQQKQAVRQACQADREKFCKNTPQEKGAMRSCMKSHEAELSAVCREKIDAFKKWKTSGLSAWEGLRRAWI